MEAYVDDMIVKSTKGLMHNMDLRAAFEVMRQHNLCLNLDKCPFGVNSGKFLGFMLSQRGIEVNPKKIENRGY